MQYSKKLYNKMKEVPVIAEMFPLLLRHNSDSALCKNGALVKVLKIEGVDFSGMSNEKNNALFKIRHAIFKREQNFLQFEIVTRKHKVRTNDELFAKKKKDLEPVNMIVDAWKKEFQSIYRTNHYLVLSVDDGGLFEKVGKTISSTYRINKQVTLNKIAKELMLELKEFSPLILEDNELTSFFSTLLNGRETYTRSSIWDRNISNQKLTFDINKSYCIYGAAHERKYSGWLSIATYPDEITNLTLDKILFEMFEFNIYQTFSTYTKIKANRIINARIKQLKDWGIKEKTAVEDLEKLQDEISIDKIALVKHCFAIEIFGDSPEDLNHKISNVKAALEQDSGALFYLETSNIEALFWSRFPTMQNLNIRQRNITSSNCAYLSNFRSIGEGFDTCGFGKRPVTLFKSTTGSQYGFSFHVSPEQKNDILGHTAIIGGTGDGKTTLIAFLIANCFPYEDFKAICFDRLSGLKIFTEIFDGDFLDFPRSVQMNPFLMKDTMTNRMFLASWLKRIGNIDPLETKYDATLQEVINANFLLDPKDRCFSEIAVVLGMEGSELRRRYDKWMPDGSLGFLFNAKRDSFNFNKRLVTFDATNILDQSEILTAITDYIFHQFMMQVSENETPHILFVDESPRYFREKAFADRFFEVLKEIRKKAGVAILAMQDVQTLINLPNNTGKEVVNALANVIYYPNSSAKKEDYMNYMGLNDKELKWIQETNPASRQVLMKRRKSGTSIVLDIDISALKTNNKEYDLLKMFDSSITSLKEVERIKKECTNTNSDYWKYQYLKK